MSRVIDTSQWIVFFTKAGLPPNVAANYALIFSDNRIQLDMLLDLSKEYLYDMGIKIMGDVIAILRYAKEFHTQLSKERMFGNASTSNVSNNKAVAERMVGHYTRRYSPVQSPHARLGHVQPQSSSKIISLKRKAPENKEVKRIRRVPPEEEGAYKIKMPTGTTERTRQILQKQKQLLQGNKRSVFSRLGDSAVSSSTDTKKGVSILHQTSSSSSVFERLGPNKNNTDDMPTSTVFSDSEGLKKSIALPYRGVLKMTVSKNRTIVSSPTKVSQGRTVIKPRVNKFQMMKNLKMDQINSILASNKVPNVRLQRTVNVTGSQGIFGLHSDVKKRLGNKISGQNAARTKILLSKAKRPVKTTSNVFDRLGR